MKKATLQYLVNLMNTNIGLNGGEDETDAAYVAARDEIAAELNKGQAQKDKNAAAYESIHSLIVDSLPDDGTFVTCAELWESIEKDVPAGITKGKVQYALSHLWCDEIVMIPGKPNTYRRA